MPRPPRTMRQIMAQRIDGIRRDDWVTLAMIILEREFQVENSDDMDAVLRAVQWDARLREANLIQRRHLWLAMTLVQRGRRHEARR